MDTSKTAWIISDADLAEAFKGVVHYLHETERQAREALSNSHLSFAEQRVLAALLVYPEVALQLTYINAAQFAALVLKKAGALLVVNAANEEAPQ